MHPRRGHELGERWWWLFASLAALAILRWLAEELLHCYVAISGAGPAIAGSASLERGDTMTILTVGERLEVEIVTEMERPYLVIKDRAEIEGGDPLWVIVYPGEVKRLLAALTDAAVVLADEVGKG